MTRPWWGRERTLASAPSLRGDSPILHAEGRGAIVRELLDRAAAYTPDWSNRRDGDAGYALARLFSEMAEPLLLRLNRLPEKALVEFLRTAGVGVLPELPAQTRLVFTVDAAAPGSVLIPEGTQVSTDPADGSDDSIIFETDRTVNAAALVIAAAYCKTGGLFEQIDLAAAQAEGAAPWRPFGPRPPVGATLMIGLAGKAAPRGNLSIGFVLAGQAGLPSPVAGGETAAPVGPTALLKWEILDGTRFEPTPLVSDGTRGLTQGGIVELRLPSRWRAAVADGIDQTVPMFWLRVRIAHGEFASAPSVRALQLNAVDAIAVQTLRDEVVEFVAGSNRRRVRLSRAPVLPGSLRLVVIESGIDGETEVEWTATDRLAKHGAVDRVYTIDYATGELEFGDGVRGMRLPLGFRNVIARSYQMGGGIGGRVAANSTFAMVRSMPFLSSVTNPQAATGGRAAEARERTMRRGPREIRTGGRAVALADYELLAQRAPGADVERARAISGYDARFPGATVPGSVTMLLVSSDRGAEPPLPDSGSLTAVASWLTDTVAPAGIQVVAAAPQFQPIGIRASIAMRAGADTGAAVDATLTALQDYLHPLRGGPGGDGWPFGGAIRHQAVTRMLLDRVPGIVAVTALTIVVDGVSQGKCVDWAIPAHALIWPDGHEVIPVVAEEHA